MAKLESEDERQYIQNALVFLERVQLTGKEVPAFNQTIAFLGNLHQAKIMEDKPKRTQNLD